MASIEKGTIVVEKDLSSISPRKEYVVFTEERGGVDIALPTSVVIRLYQILKFDYEISNPSVSWDDYCRELTK